MDIDLRTTLSTLCAGLLVAYKGVEEVGSSGRSASVSGQKQTFYGLVL